MLPENTHKSTKAVSFFPSPPTMRLGNVAYWNEQLIRVQKLYLLYEPYYHIC